MAELEKHRDVLKTAEAEVQESNLNDLIKNQETLCPTCQSKMVDNTCAKCKKAEVEESQKLCPTCDQPMTDNTCAKCKKAEVIEPVAEVKAEEPVAEIKAEDVKVAEPVAEVKADAPMDMPMDTPVQETPETESTTPTTTVTDETEKTTVTTDPVAETVTVTEEKTVVVTVDNEVKVDHSEIQETTYSMAQVDAIKADYEKQVSDLKAQIVSKDEEIVKIKATSDKLAINKLALASNEFAKDYTDADYLDDAKVENAKLKLEANKSEKVVAKSEPVVLSTGHTKVDASEDNISPLGKLLRSKQHNKK